MTFPRLTEALIIRSSEIPRRIGELEDIEIIELYADLLSNELTGEQSCPVHVDRELWAEIVAANLIDVFAAQVRAAWKTTLP